MEGCCCSDVACPFGNAVRVLERLAHGHPHSRHVVQWIPISGPSRSGPASDAPNSTEFSNAIENIQGQCQRLLMLLMDNQKRIDGMERDLSISRVSVNPNLCILR